MIKVAIHPVSDSGVGPKIGHVEIHDSEDGLVFSPKIFGLPPGVHGFHIHEHGSIEPKNGVPAGSAGEHFDPHKTHQHLGPYRDGHLGDLPRLWVNESGEARLKVVAPRLKLSDVLGLALIIHKDGDNYSDHPLKDGGGRLRIAGGIITNDCPYCR